MLHKAFAIKSSEFFRAAVSRSWRESTDKTIKLPDVEPTDFERYVQWLYTSIIPLDINEDYKSPEDNGKIAAAKSRLVVKAYFPGCFFNDSAYRNAAIDATTQVTKETDIFPGLTATNLSRHISRATMASTTAAPPVKRIK